MAGLAHTLVASGLQAVLVAQTVAGVRSGEPDGRRIFATTAWLRSAGAWCAVVVLLVVWCRLPWAAVGKELNPDEGCFLAQAHRYTADIVPWRATHSGTSGPFTPWLLAGLAQLGMPLNYPAAHFTALGLQVLLLVVSYLTVRLVSGDGRARMATLPAASVLAHTGDPNLVHLSSEQVPLLLLAGAALAGTAAVRHEPGSISKLFIAGLLAGAVSFAKLQAVPLGMVVVATIAAAVVASPAWQTRRLQGLLALAAGGVTVPAAMMLLVASGGAWSDFVTLYLTANVEYGFKQATATPAMIRLWKLIGESPPITLLLAQTVAVGVVAGFVVVRCRKAWRQPPVLMLAAAVVYGGVAAACIVKSGYPFRHYLLLFVHPAILSTGAALGVVAAAGSRDACATTATASGRCVMRLMKLAIVAVAVACLAVPAWRGGGTYLEGRPAVNDLLMLEGMIATREARTIRSMTAPGDAIAVWGWRADIYVESGRMPAVREVALWESLQAGPRQQRAREMFLTDLIRSQPQIFVDAVCPIGHLLVGWQVFGRELVDPRLGGHETFPELAAYIARHYVGREQVLYDKGSIRIYERRPSWPLGGR